MFAFKIWSKFGAFKDPMTISQNITLNFPPKTAVAGMMAAILGIDEYLKDDGFNSFKYSVVINSGTSKKSFSQNYINDYTKKTNSHLANLQMLNFKAIKDGLRDTKAPQKPINRELLINPAFTIFIDGFEFEDEIVKSLKSRLLKYNLYMGNSEFSANFSFLPLKSFLMKKFDFVSLDSFLEQSLVESIEFDDNVFYKNTLITTKLNHKRSPIKSINLVHSNSKITAKNIEAYEILTSEGKYFCRFV
ncbi:CRISPR-associated protein cas5, subtype I-b/hmari [Campylobacter ureolyticus ACS-301-V-Sch3b]|uniref:CRISPR-associated protein cas5, subtype I-b/hmari n=1 Tax=Campylobacter ureolyticus ACS-301-V-Sch3b TaxID=883165 RepID=S3X9S3_9BACT|nr:CRISPR-associated protein Cas5 [Campylobacter ureolyticus]EPH07559.1 CRISPR-associated protein cas5, subtype I-b/hmari [Campylobacter ureolyticus ACS-301-V-Sch3b]